MCAFTACVRFLRRRGPAGLRNLFFDYSVVILHRYQSANNWNYQSRLLDVPTSIAKPSVFCYNILKSR